jgi:Restriction endonuclease
MVRQLDWRDFETLVDLIFARGGWQRSSAPGKHQPDVDLILTQPTTDESAWVQIKSKANQARVQRLSRSLPAGRQLWQLLLHLP